MKVRVTLFLTDEERRAVSHYSGRDKIASHEDIKGFLRAHLEALLIDLMNELMHARGEGKAKL